MFLLFDCVIFLYVLLVSKYIRTKYSGLEIARVIGDIMFVF